VSSVPLVLLLSLELLGIINIRYIFKCVDGTLLADGLFDCRRGCKFIFMTEMRLQGVALSV